MSPSVFSKRARHVFDESRWRVVRDEVHSKLARDELCARGLAHQQCHCLLHFAEAAARNRLSEQGLGAEVVAGRVEFEYAFAPIQGPQFRFELRDAGAGIDGNARQDPGEFLDVALRIARIYTECMQLHELTRVVLVELAGGILFIIKVLQHRRMLQGRQDQIAEVPQCMGSDRVFLVVTEHPFRIVGVAVDAEVVQPEPDELLL